MSDNIHQELPMHVPVISGDLPIWAIHDVACPVCQVNKAVLDTGVMVFVPCDSCRSFGWETRRRRRGRKGRWPQ